MRTMYAAVAVTMAVGVVSADAGVIGIDGRSGGDPATNLGVGSSYAAMRQQLMDLGHSVVVITDWNAGTLAGVDAVLLLEAPRAAQVLSAAEVDAITAFNNAGGGVGYFANGGYASDGLVDTNNAMVNRLGASMVGSAGSASGLVVEGFLAHPVTMGVSQWGTDFVRQVVPGGEQPGVDLTIDGAPEDLLIARDGVGGQGNAVVMGDASWMSNSAGTDYRLDSLDNTALFNNTIEYLLVPTPMSVAVLGLGGVFAGRRRR